VRVIDAIIPQVVFGIAIGMLVGAGIASQALPDDVRRVPAPPALSKMDSKAEVERHFNLGTIGPSTPAYTVSFRLPPGPCYDYLGPRAQWFVRYCYRQDAPRPSGYPLEQ
jgi:hypothetical protein